MAATKPRVRVRVPEEDIQWESVLEALLENGGSDEKSERRSLKSFVRKVRAPFNGQWLRSPLLTGEEQKISLALSELFGADVVTILRERSHGNSHFMISYKGEVELNPFGRIENENDAAGIQAAAGRRGFARGSFRLVIAGIEFDINTMPRVVLLYTLLMLISVVMYVLVVGMLLYAVAVFLLFIADPEMMTVVAARNPPVGLALLCLLTGLAGLSGKALRNVVSLIMTRLRRQAKAVS